MSITSFQSIRKAVGGLNPRSIRDLCDRPLNIALYASAPENYRPLEEFFLQGISEERRREAAKSLHRGPDPKGVLNFDIAIYDDSVLAPRRAMVFHRSNPDQLINDVLREHGGEVGLPLARTFQPFRLPYIEQVIHRTSKENAIFSMATALPDIIPTLFEIPWAVTEFASDTAVLTANQIRMAFLIAAASDREVGFREQKREIATVVGGAFGWRALARQLISKIPFGAGVLPKAAVAYAATRLVGLSLERYYRIGYPYTRQERQAVYGQAFEHGKAVARRIISHLRPELVGKKSGTAPGDREHQRSHHF
jgi:hypothetical protein